jgi:hypothetical protein
MAEVEVVVERKDGGLIMIYTVAVGGTNQAEHSARLV